MVDVEGFNRGLELLRENRLTIDSVASCLASCQTPEERKAVVLLALQSVKTIQLLTGITVVVSASGDS